MNPVSPTILACVDIELLNHSVMLSAPFIAKIFGITLSPMFLARPSFLLFAIVKNPSID